MQLTAIRVKNFRSLKNVKVKIHDLTVFIGENDAGKSSFLDLLDMMLNDKTPADEDYYKCVITRGADTAQEVIEDKIEFTLTFALDDWDKPSISPFVSSDGQFRLRRVYLRGGSSQTSYFSEKFKDDRLNQDFTKIRIQRELQELIDALQISYEGQLNAEKRLELLDEYRKTAEKEDDWIDIAYREIKPCLPIFQRYKAIDYKSPETFVRRTLELVYRGVIYETVEDREQPVSSLRELTDEADEEIEKKLQELLVFIQKYYPPAAKLDMDRTYDFTKGFSVGEFLIDDGRGLHLLSRRGDGTKRRMLMGILDWDRQVVSELGNQPNDRGYSIIRGYDEPDANLHYTAQNKMFSAISELAQFTEGQQFRIQPIICTHSLTMIDRSPARNINLLRLEEGCTQVDCLRTGDEEDIEDFLCFLARELGITNTMLFYERCYFVFEGETEQLALSRFYQRLYGTSPLDDGIRFINLHGNGAWKPLLELLGHNKQEVVVSLLDADAYESCRRKFESANFELSLWEKKTFWIGAQEFEDAFSDETICRCLNVLYPRVDSRRWEASDIEMLRTRTSARRKFSAVLAAGVRGNCNAGARFQKSSFGDELGKLCDPDEIPEAITNAFQLARSIASGS